MVVLVVVEAAVVVADNVDAVAVVALVVMLFLSILDCCYG